MAIGAGVAVAGIGAAIVYIANYQQPRAVKYSQPAPAASLPPDEMPSKKSSLAPSLNTFDQAVKPSHYVSSSPEHGSTVVTVPLNVVVNFDFDLSSKSTLAITRDGKNYGVGETKIDAIRRVLRRQVATSLADGVYTVAYSACWPDNTCHDGRFQFAVDSLLATQYYTTKMDQKNVTVRLTDYLFEPPAFKIKKGTTVTWINDDAVVHYINSDPHPGHSYYPALNSAALKKSESYAYTFTQPGLYLYHCSAHAADMRASIWVVE